MNLFALKTIYCGCAHAHSRGGVIGQFSPHSVWELGMELRLSGLQQVPLPTPPSHQLSLALKIVSLKDLIWSWTCYLVIRALS